MPHPKLSRDIANARKLRRQMSLPEVLLWQRLKGSPLGVRIRRQHPIDDYVLDFYCAKSKLAFEIDGAAHDRGNRPERDDAKEEWLRAQDITVKRIPAAEVMANPDDVAEVIVRLCLG